jgi:hypothetical protein
MADPTRWATREKETNKKEIRQGYSKKDIHFCLLTQKGQKKPQLSERVNRKNKQSLRNRRIGKTWRGKATTTSIPSPTPTAITPTPTSAIDWGMLTIPSVLLSGPEATLAFIHQLTPVEALLD